jgi:hypothetical protein
MPAPGTAPRTYILRLTVGRRVYDNVPGRRPRAPVVRILGVEAGLPRRSYAPGERADLNLATDAESLRLQVFQYTSQLGPRERDFKTTGTAMTAPVRVDWRGHTAAPSTLRLVRAGDWPSGLYFLRLSTGAAASATRPSSSVDVCRGPASRSCSRRTRGRPTTSGTRTATAGVTAGTWAGSRARSTWRGPISTSASPTASATGISTSSPG